jgi:hypothetical protein
MAAGRRVTAEQERRVGELYEQGMRHPDQEGSGCWQTRAAAPGADGARLSARSNTTAPTGYLQLTMTNTTRRQDLAALPSGRLALSGLFPG